MLSCLVAGGDRYCDLVSRRELLRIGGLGLGGLSLVSLLGQQAPKAGVVSSEKTPNSAAGRAKSAIILYLSGGPSQLDMWDLKPHAPEEIRGTFRPTATNVPGIHICQHMPRMARLADRYTIVRSMSHQEADHIRGGYWVWSGGHLQRPVVQASGMDRTDRPHFGAVLHKLLGASRTMPPFVMVPEHVSPVGVPRPGQNGGFLGAAFDPYLIDSDPNLQSYTPGPLKRDRELSSVRLSHRQSMLAAINHRARYLERTAAVRELDPYFVKAFDLISSTDAQRAFDVKAETQATRDRYGRHIFGQSTLIARRLIEAGVRLVQVNFIRRDNAKGGQGYDSHSVPPNPPHLKWAKEELLPPTDNAFSALIEDLCDRGLIDETLVIMMGEFGRTPRFNKDGGRDHWPQCYSLVIAGGGIAGGRVYGASDKIAAHVTADPVSPAQLLATVYHQFGIDPQAELLDRQQRPHRLVEADPIFALLG